jgi:hypothetical protein
MFKPPGRDLPANPCHEMLAGGLCLPSAGISRENIPKTPAGQSQAPEPCFH